MQLTMNIYDMSSSELELIEALIRVRKEKVLGYEAPSNQVVGCIAVETKPESNQPTLPFDGEIDTTVSKEPVKKRSHKQNKVPTSDEKSKEVSEHAQEVNTSSVTLQELKELAQRRVASTDRESVKSIISKYGEKLTEVPESKYLDLYDELANLKD